jgi:hypothetical protein
MPGAGAEIVLTSTGSCAQTRLFRSHEQAELVGATADTRTMFEGRMGVMRIRQWRPWDPWAYSLTSVAATNL